MNVYILLLSVYVASVVLTYIVDHRDSRVVSAGKCLRNVPSAEYTLVLPQSDHLVVYYTLSDSQSAHKAGDAYEV